MSNGYCSVCGKKLELTGDINGMCWECNTKTFNENNTYQPIDISQAQIMPLKEALEGVEYFFPINYRNFISLLSPNYFEGLEAILGHLIWVKKAYGNEKDEKLTRFAKELKNAINVIWADMELHVHTEYTYKDAHGKTIRDINKRFKDIVKEYKIRHKKIKKQIKGGKIE